MFASGRGTGLGRRLAPYRFLCFLNLEARKRLPYTKDTCKIKQEGHSGIAQKDSTFRCGIIEAHVYPSSGFLPPTPPQACACVFAPARKDSLPV